MPQLILTKFVQQPPGPALSTLSLLRRMSFPVSAGAASTRATAPSTSVGPERAATQNAWTNALLVCSHLSLRIMLPGSTQSYLPFLSWPIISEPILFTPFVFLQGVFFPWRFMVSHINRHPASIRHPDRSEYMGAH